MIINDEYFMREAIVEAEKALSKGNWPVGCVIVLEGEIIARGFNQVYSGKNKILHAEIAAIQSAGGILSEYGHNCSIYVTYEPCPMCLGAILLNHFKNVIYGTDIDGSGALSLIDHLPPRFQSSKYDMDIRGKILETECRDVFLRGGPVKKLFKYNDANEVEIACSY